MAGRPFSPKESAERGRGETEESQASLPSARPFAMLSLMRAAPAIAVAAILALALAAQLLGLVQPVRELRPAHLAAAFPSAAAGWTVRDVPMGPTEAAAANIEAELKYDDVVYRRFERRGDFFEVYVAYWGPARLPVRKVASHTPDRCWTGAGWTCLERSSPPPLGTAGGLLPPVHQRLFEAERQRQHVLFWHLVDGVARDYGERSMAVPEAAEWLGDFLHQLRHGKPEQYFIRLNSNLPFERLRGEPAFEEVLEAVRTLAPPAPSGA